MWTKRAALVGGALGCLLAAPAHAIRLTRDEVVRRAAAQNPQVAAARAEAAKVEAQKAQAEAARWPTVTIQAGTGPSEKAKLVPGSDIQSTRSIYDFRLSDLSALVGANASIVQPLYTFGKIDDRIEAAEHGITARNAQAEMTRAEVALEAARLYEGYLFARDAQRFMEEIVHTADRSLQRAQQESQVQGSNVTQADVLRLQAALGAAQMGQNRAVAGAQQALAGLHAYLGIPEGEPIEVADEALAPVAAQATPVEQYVATAQQKRPEFQALREGALAYEKLADAERAGLYPDFVILGSLSAVYTWNRDKITTRYVVDPLYHFVPVLLVGLQWTWQDGMASARGDEQAAEATKLRDQLAWAEQGVPAEVRKAWQDADQARRDIDSAEAGVGAAKKWAVQADLDFTAGLTDARNLEDAVSRYTTLRLAQLDAVYRLNTALAELARATGTLTENGGPYTGGTKP
jgi:outer membrane protein TolC